ncbi:MAG: ATP-binding cassette domain-containing protein [candidate division NC10 bacterium]
MGLPRASLKRIGSLRVETIRPGGTAEPPRIFRNLSFTFEKGHAYAILGRNGSGKSTLLQVIAGSIHPTTGTLKYTFDGMEISDEKIFRYISCSAPYLELIEEFKLQEMLQFHFRFKAALPGFTINKIIGMLGFKNQEHKPIRLFSSGMKQRVKLILAFLSDTPLLLLDEPTTNLDQAGADFGFSISASSPRSFGRCG